MKKLLIASVLGFLAIHAHSTQYCDGPPKRSRADFAFLADGAQVKDLKTGLIWDRCIEGQRWTGAVCLAVDPQEVNPGPGATFEQAMAMARSRHSEQERWRLPTKQELLTLREPNCANPSMDLAIFPTSPEWSSDGAFWTSTKEDGGYAVVSAIGNSDAWSAPGKDHLQHVRLVRDTLEATPSKSPKRK